MSSTIIEAAATIIRRYGTYNVSLTENLYVEIRKAVIGELSPPQYAALISFVSNLGMENFKKSTLLKKINDRNFAAATSEFHRWIYSKGKPDLNLIKRRKEETLLFTRGTLNNLDTIPLLDRTIYTMSQHGYKIFSEPFKPNIVGIRGPERKGGSFDDRLVVFYNNAENRIQSHIFDCFTTDPGLHYLKNPLNTKGTAVIKAGQYLNVYAYGLHKGHPALIQVGPITYYRDNNKNPTFEVELDAENINPLNFPVFTSSDNGLNIHGSTKVADAVLTDIGKWSAGCQVLGAEAQYKEFINIIQSVGKYAYNKLYSYTLINSLDKEFTLLF
jgi:hypothetical protein